MTQMAETSVARSSDGSDPEDDEQGGSDMEENAKRQRGKRRRGRKDTSKKVEVEQGTPASTGPGEISKGDVTTKLVERYCLGRKPVTDFVVGQECKGKVVYMKAFGVFLDIGCHSDAFCHISRLQDTFVEKPEELLNVGDEVTSRIVEVDRRRKRITVSMQSADMMEKELKSIESRKERMQRHAKKSKPLHTRPSVMAVPPSKDASETDKQEERRDPTSTPVASPRMPSSSSNQQEQPSGKRTSVPSTHADLKRERKLARRAARRATNEPGEDGDLSQ
jgi:predicted RNA-binding protein with RPS1 domain